MLDEEDSRPETDRKTPPSEGSSIEEETSEDSLRMKSSASTNGFYVKHESKYDYMMCLDFDSKNDYLNDLYYKEEERIYEDLCCVTFSRQFPEVPYMIFSQSCRC